MSQIIAMSWFRRISRPRYYHQTISQSKRPIIFFLSLLISLLSFTLISAVPFQVLNISEDEIILHFEMPEYELFPVEVEGVLYHKIIGNFTSYHYEEGFPEIPFYAENVGIPIDGGIELHISNIQRESLADILIHPVEKLEVNGYEVESIFYRDRVAYNNRDYYPAQVLHQGVTAFAGDRRFASFVFNPIRYNPRDRQLAIITEATISIRIIGNRTANRDWIPGRSYIDRAGDLFFLNNEYSQNWRKPRNYNPDYTPSRSFGINAFQFSVDTEGIYKVTYEDLAEVLALWQEEEIFPVNIDITRRLRLSVTTTW